MMAMTSSAMTEMTTSTPHHMLHRSHDDDASSNIFSMAFIVPFGRYHAGKNRLRTVLIALTVWTLMYVIIFAAILLIASRHARASSTALVIS
jgi:hypothetical protein